jgi:hypothetical protein
MVSNEIMDSLKQTLSELRIAENELNRPVEDVVTLSLCVTARKSMSKLMHLYLHSKNLPHNPEHGLHDLLDACLKSDKQFEDIKLDKIYCNGLNHAQCEDKHCLNYGNVEECVNTANRIKGIVLNKLELKESDLD